MHLFSFAGSSPSAWANGSSSGPVLSGPSRWASLSESRSYLNIMVGSSGAIVLASAVAWLLFHPREWRTRSTAATWGWGVIAAIVAALVYWPWFRFVDSHGGYRALLAHQRSYLGSLSSWPGHWSLQLAQERFLSGNPVWVISGGLVAAIAMLCSTGDVTSQPRRLPRLLLETIGLAALCSIRGSSWWLTLVWIWFALDKSRGLWTKSLADRRHWLGNPLGLDAVLSSLRQALAAGRGVRLAVPGGSVRVDPIEPRGRRPRSPMGLEPFVRSAAVVHPALRAVWR